MRKFGYFLLALAITVVGSIATAQLPFAGRGRFIVAVNDYTLNDENPLIFIKYLGTSESGTIDLATSSLEFHDGVVGSEAASTAFDTNDVNNDGAGAQVCGSNTGALDLTNAACDTFGELVDVINDSGSNWVAVLVGAAPGDTIAAGTDFIDPADKLCKQNGGCVLYPDSSVHDETVGWFAPWIGGTFDGVTAGLEKKHSIEPFLTRGGGTRPGSGQVLRGNPVPSNYVPCLTAWMINQDGTGAGVLSIFEQHYGDRGQGVNSVTAGDGSPTTLEIYQIATVDDTELLSSVNRIINPICGSPGTTLLIRGTGFTALTDTADELQFQGFYFERT